MFDFENKPIKDWTLKECKEYCKNTHHKGSCIIQEDSAKYCVLAKNNTYRFSPACYNLTTLPDFTSDEIAFIRLVKKTYPCVNYISRSKFNSLKFIELTSQFDERGNYKLGTTGCFITIQPDFFPQIKSLTYYAIDDIIKTKGE